MSAEKITLDTHSKFGKMK